MVDSAIWLRDLIFAHSTFEYIIIFLSVAFVGELVILALAFLVAQKFIALVPFVLLSFLGTFFSNTIWFLLGKTNASSKVISHKYASPAASAVTDAIVKMSKGKHLNALVIIKFLLGTAVALTMYSNKTDLRWRDFLLGETVAIALSLLVLVPIGLSSGLGFNYLSDVFNNVYGGLGVMLFLVFVFFLVQKWFKNKLTGHN